jgi:cellulose synthase (UDP-forming)
MQAAAPGIMAAAVLLAVLPWLPTNWQPVRVILITVSIALVGRYLWWRYTATLPPSSEPLNFAAGIIFIAIETVALLSAAISMFFLTGVRDRSGEADEHRDWVRDEPKPPLIDVLICTYDEEERILERTILGATGLDYPNFRVWVLDDGKRPWLEKLCLTLKCGYITRPDNRHAKAGNINHALGKLAEMLDPPRFIAVLDADFVPRSSFLSRAMCLFHDPAIGIVQTPQHYINPDPIQTNLSLAGVWPDEQRYFFDIVMPAKDAWGVAFCCGTSSITRFEALTKIGGLPTDSVTEDLPAEPSSQGDWLHHRLPE